MDNAVRLVRVQRSFRRPWPPGDDRVRRPHVQPRRCEDLKATLWPEIKAAHEEITNMFEEERMETYELSQQAQTSGKQRELFATSCRAT